MKLNGKIAKAKIKIKSKGRKMMVRLIKLTQPKIKKIKNKTKIDLIN
jgi:hypothetical protein